jgi:tetratricopeptide (TPR) repeat protein
MREKSAALLLSEILGRARDRAKAMAKAKASPSLQGWSELVTILLPFLKFTENICPKVDDRPAINTWLQSISKEEFELVDTYTNLVPCAEWMLSSSVEISNRIPKELFPFVEKLLSALFDRAAEEKKEYQASSNVLKSSTEPMDLKIREIENARVTMQNLLFFQDSSDATKDMRSHVERAVTMTQRPDKYQLFSSQYGASYSNMIMAWSGFQQIPWAFCTAPEARLLHKQAEQCITQANIEWGRPIAPMEKFILDLAQGDLECGLLAGGFRSVASKLFSANLKSLETPVSGVSDAFHSVLKSHCLIGLTRIALLEQQDPVEKSSAEKFAQDSIQELSSIPLDQNIPSTYLWSSPESTSDFIKFHMSLSRQLVADSLVRLGRLQEARKFLEDAVRDSPKDAEAAFSLGAFLLREAYASKDRSADDINGAKMQLLKAAKLDSQKAGPFALLGVWYEEQNDLKRALGCYSKALLLDPPHPVAGRGVLRLAASVDSAKSVLDNAVQPSSPVNGWAWRAIGKQKVMVTGENDLGAVALLKALRCRDIDSPQNEQLSVFYKKPTVGCDTPDNYVGKERAEVWAELAFCYRRLGRYTAAIRGYYSSIEAAGEYVSASVLCSCAEGKVQYC